MPKRTFWLMTGTALGVGSTLWAEVMADIAVQSSQLTAQSQMSPSEYDSSIDVPVTSTGSP